MEHEVVAFLKRILATIGLSLLWLSVNATMGIMFELGFIHEKIRLGNLLFYAWLIASFIAYVLCLLRIWRGHISFNK